MSENTRAILWITLAYAVAIAAAVASGYALRSLHPLAVVAIADVVGTVVIFAFSLAFNNSSFYDPYWSVAPMVISAYYAVHAPVPLRAAIVVALVWAWGARLTYNFLKGWPNVLHEDWRYVNIRKANGRAYWLVSFFGIHLAPTAWVYLGCLSLYPAITSSSPFSFSLIQPSDISAAWITLVAISLETVADRQLWRFRETQSDSRRTMQSGLWRFCRHPNYLGEILFWWGLCLVGYTASYRPGPWWTVVGPLSITLLFVYISIPMIEKRHLERRAGYAEYMKSTPVLWPDWRKIYK